MRHILSRHSYGGKGGLPVDIYCSIAGWGSLIFFITVTSGQGPTGVITIGGVGAIIALGAFEIIFR